MGKKWIHTFSKYVNIPNPPEKETLQLSIISTAGSKMVTHLAISQARRCFTAVIVRDAVFILDVLGDGPQQPWIFTSTQYSSSYCLSQLLHRYLFIHARQVGYAQFHSAHFSSRVKLYEIFLQYLYQKFLTLYDCKYNILNSSNFS